MSIDEKWVRPLRGAWTEVDLELLTTTFAKVLWHCANHMQVLADAGRDEQARAAPVQAALERCLMLATLGARHRLEREPTFSTLDTYAHALFGTVAVPPAYARPPDAEHRAPDLGADA